MAHEGGYYRFFAEINLFMFFMLTLVMAANLVLMFVGWEGVGLCSYLLIGFFFRKKSAADAGKKAFITTRIGDLGFMLGIFLTFWTFGSIDYAAIFRQAAQMPIEKAAPYGVLTSICLLLFAGAVGKSAQLPLYVWLPDAMEGPTPVSALIHAATMVTAGVYMVARMHVFYSKAPAAMLVVATIGALTAFYAATIGLVQTDIKKVLAYSTISQLGYMFLGCGVGAYAAGIFHLMTHAFFKGLLFLAAGSVIHAMGGQQDMREMGGLRKKIPGRIGRCSRRLWRSRGFRDFRDFSARMKFWKRRNRGRTRIPGLWALGISGSAADIVLYVSFVVSDFFWEGAVRRAQSSCARIAGEYAGAAGDSGYAGGGRRMGCGAAAGGRRGSFRALFESRYSIHEPWKLRGRGTRRQQGKFSAEAAEKEQEHAEEPGLVGSLLGIPVIVALIGFGHGLVVLHQEPADAEESGEIAERSLQTFAEQILRG